MERKQFTCTECDNECKLSFREDSPAIPESCPLDPFDDTDAKWETDQ